VGFYQTRKPIRRAAAYSSSFPNPVMETAGLYTENRVYSQPVCIIPAAGFFRMPGQKWKQGQPIQTLPGLNSFQTLMNIAFL
jgi:hypothetical protein